MSLPTNLSPAYLRVLRADLQQFTTTLLTRLEQIETAKEELYKAQTWLLQNGAPLCILANQNTASNYLSNHHLALVELLRITSHLLAVVQALLYSVAEPTPPDTP
jgi:hypothetical protein